MTADDVKEPTPQPEILDLVIRHLEQGEDEQLTLLLTEVEVEGVANVLASLPKRQRQRVWLLLPNGLEGELLPLLSDEIRDSVIDLMEYDDVVAATESMDTATLAEMISKLPDMFTDAILESLDQDRRERLETTLSFAEESAGRWMSSDVISVRKDITLEVVLRYLRRLKTLPVHTDGVMVTDDNGTLLGKLMINDVLTGQAEQRVAEVMNPLADRIPVEASEREIAQLFEKRGLISVAVVDQQEKLLGRITIDDAMEIIRLETDKAVLNSAGLNKDEELFSPAVPSAKRRALWLGINLVTVFMASWVIGQFEAVLDKIVALAILMPIVASMGGIAGSQTLALTIRGLTLGQLSLTNLNWLAHKEITVGLLNGTVWSLVVGAMAYLWFQDLGIAIIIALAIIINLVAATLSGVLIPFTLEKLGIDPALSGAVILTTVTDVIGFLSFLGLATLFLL